jgi:hypothetical protein
MFGDADLVMKKAFAAALLQHPNNAFEAALSIVPDTGRALRIYTEWTNDPVVIEERNKLTEDCEELDLLPDKAKLAKEIWDRMVECRSPEDFGKLAELYGKVRGFIEKPSPNVQNNFTSNKVMVVTNNGSNEQWAEKLERQQRALSGEITVN